MELTLVCVTDTDIVGGTVNVTLEVADKRMTKSEPLDWLKPTPIAAGVQTFRLRDTLDSAVPPGNATVTVNMMSMESPDGPALLICARNTFDIRAARPAPPPDEAEVLAVTLGSIAGLGALICAMWCRVQYSRWKYEQLDA